MSKQNFVVAQAVNLVARNMAPMDANMKARLSKALNEEAESIFIELLHSGEYVDAPLIATKLYARIAQVKHPAPTQVLQQSSHRSDDPYLFTEDPNQPLRRATQTQIHHRSSAVRAINHLKDVYSNDPPFSITKHRPPQSQTYPQMPLGQHTLNSRPAQLTEERSGRLSRSSTVDDDRRLRSLSRSTSDSEVAYSFANPRSKKIRVNVITNSSATADNRRLKVKQNKAHHRRGSARRKSIHTSENILIGSRTMDDLPRVVNSPTADPSAMAERIIIIDREAVDTAKISSKSPVDSTLLPLAAPQLPIATMEPAPVHHGPIPNSISYTAIQPSYYSVPQTLYQEPQWFMMAPYISHPTGYYPFVYYSY